MCVYVLIPIFQRVEYDVAVVALFPLHFAAVFRHYPAPEDGQDCRMQLAVSPNGC